MHSQTEKALAFQALHQRDGLFVIPNPWDIGTARLLAYLGYEALATTSAGFAYSKGQRDTDVGLDQMMAHVRELAPAVDLPLSVDLRNGFGDSPEAVAATIRATAEAGAVGGSIEDSTGRAGDPMYTFEAAVDRVRAAAEAARRLPFPFVLTARCENYLNGRPDLDDTIRRLRAYEQAGADVLFAPCLPDRASIARVLSSVSKPVNVLLCPGSEKLTIAELKAMGVRRVSVGSAFFRAAMAGFLAAARELQEQGTFGFTERALGIQEARAMYGG